MTTVGRWTRGFGVIAALVVTSALAGAQSWTAVLTGAAEATPNASPGTGSATFSLTGTVLTINGTFTGLLGPTTASHIHCCTAAALTGAAGVATTTPSFAGFPLGVTNGSFTILLDLAQASSYNAAFVTANGSIDNARAALIAGMNSGKAYLNIHTSQFPGGEIRGFIVSTVPEPASVFLTMAGLFGVAMIGVRRRRAAP
jgi:CHRD domain